MEAESTGKQSSPKKVSSEIAGNPSGSIQKKKNWPKEHSFGQFQLLSIKEGSLWVAGIATAIKPMVDNAGP